MNFFVKKHFLIGYLFLISVFLFSDSKYKVNKGDTLYSISKKYEITVAELRTANNLSENDVIKIGQVLIIPSANINDAATLNSTVVKNQSNKKTKEYIVKKGETLYRIAKNNGMSVGELMALNNLDSNAVIKVGQKLKVYDNKATSLVDNPSTVTISSKDTRTYGQTVNSDATTIWPVKNPKVTPVKGKVTGVQLSAQKNEDVTCIREGTVMYVGVYRGYGQLCFIQSKTGLIYAYAGLSSINVSKGDYIDFGKKIGAAGIDSISGKSQITFMVFQNGQPIDPSKAPRN